MLNKIFNTTNHQKILNFLAIHLGEEYYDRQISHLTGVSSAGTNFALRDLVTAGLAKREQKGRMYFYSIDRHDIIIKQFKIFQNILTIYPLINNLKKISLKLILYGSSSKGENLKESDLDIFVITINKKEVKDILFKSELKEKLRSIIMSPNELAKLKKNETIFYEEIFNGITLWEQKEI